MAGVDYSKLREKFEHRKEKADRMNMKDGDNNVRILPPSMAYFSDGDTKIDYIHFEFLMHFNLGVEGEKKAEVCPKSFGKTYKCPVCEAVSLLYKTNTIEDKAQAGDLRAKKRYIFNVINLDDVEKGIQVMEVGPKIYEEIIKYATNPKWGDLLDLDKGRNFVIEKKPKSETASGYVEYSVAPDPEPTSIKDLLPKGWKESLDKLAKQVPTAKTYDELKAVLEGTETAPEAPVQETESEKEEASVKKVVSAPVKTAVKKAVVAVEKEEEPADEPADEVAGTKPDCFGEEYNLRTRKEQCVKCPVKNECRDKYLDM
jgi:hypothetical protein